jgi:hypothetical protein
LHAQTLGPPGTTWGGEHVRLQVTETGAVLDFDCSSGAILRPLVANAQGAFKVRGTITRERGGPVRQDSSNTAAPATYSGAVNGDTMKLRITIGSQNESTEDFVLVRDKPGHIVKCR